MRQHWKQVCGINDDVNVDNFRICEDHFQDAVFLTSRQLLEATTTPDVFLMEVANAHQLPCTNQGLFAEHGYCLPSVAEDENIQQGPIFSNTDHDYCLPCEENEDESLRSFTDEIIDNKLETDSLLQDSVELGPSCSFWPHNHDMHVAMEETVHNTIEEAAEDYSFLEEEFETDGENNNRQQKGILSIILILGLTGWTGVFRLVRAEYMKHTAREYVLAAKAIGVSNLRRMFVHIFPNVSHIALVQMSILVVAFIKSEVILSFLGFGVPIGVVSWGSMLNEAQSELILGKWWQLAAASIAMAILVTAFSMFTDALRDALDPKLK